MTRRRELGEGVVSIGMGTVWAIVGVVAAIVVLAVGTFGFGWFRSTTADFRGGVQQRDLTNGNGQYRIAQYDDFHNRCTALIAAQEQVDQDSTNPYQLPAPIAAQNLAADASSYRDQAATYNAKASATATAGQFRDSGLPFAVPATYVPNGDKITCG